MNEVWPESSLDRVKLNAFTHMPSTDQHVSMHERILDAALRRAATTGWDELHLHELARDLGMSMASLAEQVPDKHSLGQWLFDRADRAMVACADRPQWREHPARQRLEDTLAAWFEALEPHRAQVRQMLRYQLQPDHLHLHVQGVLRVSRTVQWWREASCLPSTGWQRETMEAGLTALYLSTVMVWLRDESPGQVRARRWLVQNLALWSRALPTLARA